MTSVYAIAYTISARRQIRKLPPDAHERVLVAIEHARIRPEQHFERLTGGPLYKLRVGDYRVLAEIDGRRLIILVVKAGHRKNVYSR